MTDNGRGEDYLEYAIKTYRFFEYLENDSGVFYDYMAFHRDEEGEISGISRIDKSVFSYNTGSPITAAIELYKITGEEKYLEDAKHWAASSDAYFAKDSDIEGLKAYKDLTWFREVLLHGYVALYPFDNTALDYIRNMENSINHAYDNHRLKGFLGYNENHMPKDWIAGFVDDDEKKRGYTLDQFPCAGIYASLAKFYQEISG